MSNDFVIQCLRNSYASYCYFVHKEKWIDTKFHTFLAKKIQKFVETKTGNAYDILVLSCPPQHGKKCSDDTPVLTINGWVKHGDLKIGDYVFGRYGEKVRITNILNESNVPDCDYLVHFTDGDSIQVHAQHEWVVYDRSKRKEITVETQFLMKNKLIHKDGNKKRCRYQVDYNTCVDFPEKELIVEPYILGAWLGDGHTTKPTIVHSKDDNAVIDKVKSYGYTVSAESIHSTTGVITTNFYGDLYSKFKSIGFANTNGFIKHIPDDYKFSSKEQRLELLAGLIDTDGYVYQKNGRITFSNANKRLIDDVEQLCISLGFKTTVSEFKPITSSSNIVGKQIIYQLTFSPDLPIPTALPRKKVSNFISVKRKRGILAITKVKAKPGKCITVEGGIYLVGKKLIPTHNSMTVTETFPSWYVGKYPDKRCIIACYNDDFAGKFGRRNKSKLDEYGKKIFGIGMTKSSDRDIEIAQHGGGIITRGIMSGITGNAGDLIIIDDPVKNRMEADSVTYRERLYEEWQNSIKTRLQAGSKVIVIQTRWHEDDLAGRIIANEKYVEIVNIPVEAEENDILGRQIGDALCPEIGKDNKWLKEFKESYSDGKRTWNALYMGRPTSAEGNMFKREWWHYYDKLPDIMPLVAISVDATFKDSDTSDFVAIETWGKLNADYYLIDLIKKRMDFPDTLKAIRYMVGKYPQKHSILIEDKANGSAIISMLKHEIDGIIPITPKESKIARANAITGIVEGGNVYLPKYADFTSEFVEEFASFPNAAHDDLVDACTQFINRFKFFGADYIEDNRTDFEKQLEAFKKKQLSGGNHNRKRYF